MKNITGTRLPTAGTATAAEPAGASGAPWKFRAKILLAAVLIASAAYTSASARTIRVPADQPTIQGGLDVADAGDTVLVAAGTYSGEHNRELDFGGEGIVLTSEAGAGGTTISCGREGCGVIFSSGETGDAVLSGFTIRYGLAAKGGGIFFENGSSPMVESCVIESCAVFIRGGGLACTSSSPVITDCTVRYNEAGDCSGAGISIDEYSSPRFEACSIYGNRITGT